MRMYITVPNESEVFQNSRKTNKAKLNARAVGVTLALVGAVLFLACSLLAVLFPEAAAKFTVFAFHTDLTGMMRSVSLGGFVVGLIASSLGFGLIAWLAAGLYNSLTKNAA